MAKRVSIAPHDNALNDLYVTVPRRLGGDKLRTSVLVPSDSTFDTLFATAQELCVWVNAQPLVAEPAYANRQRLREAIRWLVRRPTTLVSVTMTSDAVARAEQLLQSIDPRAAWKDTERQGILLHNGKSAVHHPP